MGEGKEVKMQWRQAKCAGEEDSADLLRQLQEAAHCAP